MQNHSKSISLLNSTQIGKHFDISANRTNWALSEIGWIKSEKKGWQATNAGIALGGVQAKVQFPRNPYVRWPATILENKILIAKINEISGNVSATQQDYNQVKSPAELNFRKKYPANYRTTDGHWVRSRSEALIDDWLYNHDVIHAYEKKLPTIEDDIISDFYIPKGNVYIEYWGMINDPIYNKRKTKKLETYRRDKFELVELTDKELENLDDILTRRLMERGIKFI